MRCSGERDRTCNLLPYHHTYIRSNLFPPPIAWLETRFPRANLAPEANGKLPPRTSAQTPFLGVTLFFSTRLRLAAIAVVSAGLIGCGGSHQGSLPSTQTTQSGSRTTATENESSAGNTTLLKTIAVPNVVAGGKFSYDIGFVDPEKSAYYLADRTNKSLDVFSTSSLTLVAQVRGFTGQGPTPDKSGPDGVVAIPGSDIVYVGDVNTVKVVDVEARSIVTTIVTGSAGLRTDEGCYDPDDKIMMFANPADAPPRATFISTETRSIVGTLPFDASGLEQCVYNPRTKNFYINNDGSTTNPTGELDVISAESVKHGAPKVSAAFPLPNCGPTGMALREEDLLIGCDPPAGQPEVTYILNAETGALKRTITQVGGSDQVAFDANNRRFYTASRNMTSTGIAGRGTTTPVLGVIDADNLKWIENVPTAANSHSVAADPVTNHIFVPLAPTATSNGGIGVYGSSVAR
jgi:hypothetical protein